MDNLTPNQPSLAATPSDVNTLPPVSLPPAPSQVIDITPGKEDQTLHAPKSVHVDEAVLPPHPVTDITHLATSLTPETSTPSITDIAPGLSSAVTSEASVLSEVVATAPVAAPVVTPTLMPETPSSIESPVTAPVSAAPAPEIIPTPASPIPQITVDANLSPAAALNAVVAAMPAPVQEPAPVVAPKVVAPEPVVANAGQDTSTFKINTTSPVYEDPDAVKLIK